MKLAISTLKRYRVFRMLGGKTGESYIRLEMPLHSVMRECFEGCDINELIQCIKLQVKNSQNSESDFSLNQIMRLHVNLLKLALTQGSSYIVLPELIATKKEVVNLKSNDGECFKWIINAPLYYKHIERHHEIIILLKRH